MLKLYLGSIYLKLHPTLGPFTKLLIGIFASIEPGMSMGPIYKKSTSGAHSNFAPPGAGGLHPTLLFFFGGGGKGHLKRVNKKNNKRTLKVV